MGLICSQGNDNIVNHKKYCSTKEGSFVSVRELTQLCSDAPVANPAEVTVCLETIHYRVSPDRPGQLCICDREMTYSQMVS